MSTFKNRLDFLNNTTPKAIFLVDSLGALLSAFFLGIILIQFEKIIGMPVSVLRLLAMIAMIFSIYSMSCFLLVKNRMNLWLNIIITGNTLYSILSLILVIYHAPQLHLFGWIYFIIELCILVFLIRIEIDWSKKIAHS